MIDFNILQLKWNIFIINIEMKCATFPNCGFVM